MVSYQPNYPQLPPPVVPTYSTQQPQSQPQPPQPYQPPTAWVDSTIPIPISIPTQPPLQPQPIRTIRWGVFQYTTPTTLQTQSWIVIHQLVAALEAFAAFFLLSIITFATIAREQNNSTSRSMGTTGSFVFMLSIVNVTAFTIASAIAFIISRHIKLKNVTVINLAIRHTIIVTIAVCTAVATLIILMLAENARQSQQHITTITVVGMSTFTISVVVGLFVIGATIIPIFLTHQIQSLFNDTIPM